MRRSATAAAVITVLGAIALAATGCSSSGSSPGATASASPDALHGTVTVFAAASLTATFTELGKTFEAEHPGTTITFSFAGSSDLVSQITEGAPADVFASADEKNMTKVTDGRAQRRQACRLRDQRARDRRPARQPRSHRLVRRPREARRENRDLRAAGAVRRCDGEGRGRHEASR